VVAISTAEYPTPAKRPPNSRLRGARLAARYGVELPSWRHCLHLCVAELYP
jgi:dTDP-4-dehydrorhamnose reductase